MARRAKDEFRLVRMGGDAPMAVPLIANGTVHPLGITTLYGESNVGKGWVACWIVRELLNEDIVPAILDYESVEWEWRSRLYSMGIREEHGVFLIQPGVAMMESMTEALREVLEEIHAGYLIVDSASAARARVGASDSGGQDAAMSIFRVLKALGMPSLLIAHRAKAGTAGPLGSVQYRNQSSMVLRAEAEGAMATKVWVDDVNDRPKPTTPFVFTRILVPGGYTDVHRQDEKTVAVPTVKSETLEQAIMRVMERLDRSLMIDEVWRELHREGWKNDKGVEPDPTVVSATIRKLVTKGKLTKLGRGKYAVPVDQTEM